METILEDQRRLHEERERLVELQVKEILRKKATVYFKKEQLKKKTSIFNIIFDEKDKRTSQLGSFGETTLGCKWF